MIKIEGTILDDVLNAAYTYLKSEYSEPDLGLLRNKLLSLAEAVSFDFIKTKARDYSYDDIQETLSTLNEKESVRKSKGVYYTPSDVVRFILLSSIKSAYGKLSVDNLGNTELNGIPYRSFCTSKSVLDPTCGAGEFLLATLEAKLNMLDANADNVTEAMLKKTVSTIHGNDINKESVIIAKIRLFLCALKRYGIKKCSSLDDVLNRNFTCCDFVTNVPPFGEEFDIIIGNPPYVEDAKSKLDPEEKFGNIYANVLKNSAEILKPNGSIGFVIPLSYVSTPRMKKIRNELFDIVTEQYILSYADRPDCLFKSVHQKLCILIGSKRGGERSIYTGNYQYWYKDERESLFARTSAVKNYNIKDDYIPKFGTPADAQIYKKVSSAEQRVSLFHMPKAGDESVYVNMRAAFWIKAFRDCHKGSEYRQFTFADAGEADYFFCLVNSSLFWWYWICVSDCWHITNKELRGFMAPVLTAHDRAAKLAKSLENKLEQTKLYVGTKQTEYEYKHRSCVAEIHDIDDYINGLFGLTDEESRYIKDFAYRYRVSGGAER